MLLSLLLCALVAGTQGAINPHIIGGEEVTHGQHAYSCSLQAFGWNGWRHICGSVIWNKQWIVTAAHCVDGSAERRVVCGLHSLKWYDDGQQSRNVIGVTIHLNYNQGPGSNPNDIAVLELDRPLDYSDTVHAFRLAKPEDGDFANQTCTISGWGETKDGYPDTMMKVDMKTITREECQVDWSKDAILSSHVCIKEFQKSSCFGDSGGPQRCGDVIVGLTSWGIWDCSWKYASVNTRVSSFYEWIRDTTKSEQDV